MIDGLTPWRASSWSRQPVVCCVVIGSVFGAVGFAGRLLAQATAPAAMVRLKIEEQAYGAIMEAAGGSRVKAEAAAAADWPSVCEPERPEIRRTRLAQALRCIKDAGAEDAPARMERFAKGAGQPLAGIAELVDKVDMEDVSCDDDPWEEYGPDSEPCGKRLNSETAFPSTTRATISALLALSMSATSVRDAALTFAGADESDGWSAFPGGRLLRPHGPERAEIAEYAKLPPRMYEELSLSELKSLARAALRVHERQEDAAESFGKAVVARAYSRATRVLADGATVALYLLALMVLWGAWKVATGWRRGTLGAGLLLLLVAFVAPPALEALGLGTAAAAAGNGDGLAAVVGAPFAVLAQMLDTLSGAARALGQPDDQKELLVAALFLVLMLSKSAAAALGAGYAIVSTPRWFESGTFTVLPVDVEAFEVASGAPVVAWVVGIATSALALLVVRGAWKAFAPSLVERGTHYLAPSRTVLDTPADMELPLKEVA